VEGIDLGGILVVLLVLVELADRVAGPGRGEEGKAAINRNLIGISWKVRRLLLRLHRSREIS